MHISHGISQKHAKAHIKKTIDSFYKYNKESQALQLWVILLPEDRTQYGAQKPKEVPLTF